MNLINQLLAYLVRQHFAIYTVIGFLLVTLLFAIGTQPSLEQLNYFLANLALPVVFYICIQNYICSFFYGEKYRTIFPYNPLRRISLGIPSKDYSFYETITSEMDLSRKIAGYVYAIAKPISFFFMGVVFASLFILVTN